MDTIIGSERVTAVFGRWPSFHDAEVLLLTFRRTEIGFDVRSSIHTWESTGEVNERGCYRLHKHTVVSFLFEDCDAEGTDLRGFGYQNVIFGLKIRTEDEWMICEFEPCYGLHGVIRSRRILVVDVEPYPPSHNGLEADSR